MLNLIGAFLIGMGLSVAKQGLKERDIIAVAIGCWMIIVGLWLATLMTMDTGPTGQAWG